MKNKLIAGTLLTVSAVGLLYAIHRHSSITETKTSAAETIPNSLQVPTVQAQNAKEVTPTSAASAVIPTDKAGPVPAKVLPEVPVPYSAELNQYFTLRSKVFMTEQEKILRKSFLNNAQLLIALGQYLNTPSAKTSESIDARNNATDLLLEAVRTEKSEVAQAALQQVIQDNGVENSAMDRGTRQVLAETKAEVLYQWSAMDPSKSEQMNAWLPGPVSQKIWQNVRQAQNQNLSESR